MLADDKLKPGGIRTIACAVVGYATASPSSSPVTCRIVGRSALLLMSRRCTTADKLTGTYGAASLIGVGSS